MATERELVRKVEEVISNFLTPVRCIAAYRDKGDVFAEIYDAEDDVLSEFNITKLATEIVRELDV